MRRYFIITIIIIHLFLIALTSYAYDNRDLCVDSFDLILKVIFSWKFLFISMFSLWPVLILVINPTYFFKENRRFLYPIILLAILTIIPSALIIYRASGESSLAAGILIIGSMVTGIIYALTYSFGYMIYKSKAKYKIFAELFSYLFFGIVTYLYFEKAILDCARFQ